MRVCATHGCPNLYPTSDGSQCHAHRKTAEKRRRPKGTPYATKGHRTFRTIVLQRDPICVLCDNALSTVADHYPLTRTELIQQGLNPNDPQHGRGLCKTDHDRHTAATSPGGWNQRE
jgi:5-methylcytosine-specific restriction protein A